MLCFEFGPQRFSLSREVFVTPYPADAATQTYCVPSKDDCSPSRGRCTNVFPMIGNALTIKRQSLILTCLPSTTGRAEAILESQKLLRTIAAQFKIACLLVSAYLNAAAPEPCCRSSYMWEASA